MIITIDEGALTVRQVAEINSFIRTYLYCLKEVSDPKDREVFNRLVKAFQTLNNNVCAKKKYGKS